MTTLFDWTAGSGSNRPEEGPSGRGPSSFAGSAAQAPVPDDERLARAALCRLLEAGDTDITARVAECGAVSVVESIRAGVLELSPRRLAGLQLRMRSVDPAADLERLAAIGGRLLCPGDEEWPAIVDELAAPPFALWVTGPLDLAECSQRAVAVVGARAATAYGNHVSTELGAGLGERGWTVVSGAAYGIDAAAHRGALAVGGATVAVLACGIDVTYPSGHAALLQRIAEEGLVVSEVPPGTTPIRPRFVSRNRVIAALARGTVVVEAAIRSGALTTLEACETLNRLAMAVPGPVTSALSAGCHEALRRNALCVTDVADVLELVGRLGEDLAPARRGEVRARDGLDLLAAQVLEALPARGLRTIEDVAVAAALTPEAVASTLGRLLLKGFVERTGQGWRLTARARAG